ncbi:hypothetical protein CLV84_1666 [Neolewinella xylanilytica]|uniref:Outer membrane protein with beta-barrel domain n=1 Tax=Neolewinella xylanilytica TaxID=1514080 RepID=A0A2S6IB52_9BACT|nr:hypothetical protein [Neolewinella xylanilytica]PPK88696.1 hypothetical protein CLV84_1666 [Neolewinella xylanilytica]
MPRNQVLIGLAFLPAFILAQSEYRSGYLITEGGERRAVEIFDQDWAANPDHFRYRTSGGEPRRGDLSNVVEFGLEGRELRYLRAEVDIESSPRQLNSLSESPLPQYTHDEVFLEVLVDGAADLFYYQTGQLVQFFYRLGDGPIKPLINRTYLSDERMVVQDLYRDVLQRWVNCGATDRQIAQLAYRRKDMLAYFEGYHRCTGEAFTKYERIKADRRFRVALRPGVDYHSTSIGVNIPGGGTKTVEYGSTVAPRLGVEAELSFRFLHGEWALVTEAYYQSYRLEWPEEPAAEAVDMEMKYLSVPWGVRRYFELSTATAAYLNLFGQFQFPFGAYVQRPLYRRPIYISLAGGGAAGLRFGDHVLAEVRYLLPQDLVRRQRDLDHRLQTMALVVGYQF